MVNKKHGPFTKEDEASFEVFASYCGLALHHAKVCDRAAPAAILCYPTEINEEFLQYPWYVDNFQLYDKIRKSEQKHKVALEMLSYHNTCKEDEVEVLKRTPFPSQMIDIDK